MKKTILMISSLLIVVGCAVANNYKTASKLDDVPVNYENAYQEIKPEDLMILASHADWSINLDDPKEVYELTNYLAIIQIDSIEGAININEFDGSKLYPSTFGKFTILKNIKGEMELNQTYNYLRMGGILPYEQYLEGLHDKEREKIETNMIGYKQPDYVQVKAEHDIDVDPGKVYLAYLNPSEHKRDSFNIVFAHAGLREIANGELYARNAETLSEVESISVLNNSTKEWEPLAILIP